MSLAVEEAFSVSGLTTQQKKELNKGDRPCWYLYLSSVFWQAYSRNPQSLWDAESLTLLLRCEFQAHCSVYWLIHLINADMLWDLPASRFSSINSSLVFLGGLSIAFVTLNIENLRVSVQLSESYFLLLVLVSSLDSKRLEVPPIGWDVSNWISLDSSISCEKCLEELNREFNTSWRICQRILSYYWTIIVWICWIILRVGNF